MKRRNLLAMLACAPVVACRPPIPVPTPIPIQRTPPQEGQMSNIPQFVLDQIAKNNAEQLFRATCTSVHDTLAGGFTVGIQRAGQNYPDAIEYRYIGPAPTVGDDVLVYRVGLAYIVAGIDETVLDRQPLGTVLTGTTAETTLYTTSVPGSTMTLVRGLLWSFIVNQNTPVGSGTLRLYANGVLVETLGPTGGVTVTPYKRLIFNRGSLAAQRWISDTSDSSAAAYLTALNSEATITLAITGQLSNAAESMQLERVQLERK